MGKYYIVDSELVPDVLEKVIQARELLQRGEVQKISEAVKRVGVSRGTYYKYKDRVYVPNNDMSARKAVISLMLYHRSGILSKVLDAMSLVHANIITINQNIPIRDTANVMISFDMSQMDISVEELLARLSAIEGVSNVRLEAIE